MRDVSGIGVDSIERVGGGDRSVRDRAGGGAQSRRGRAGGDGDLRRRARCAMSVESASIRLSELAVGIGPFVIGPAVERKAGAAALAAMAIYADGRDARCQWNRRRFD